MQEIDDLQLLHIKAMKPSIQNNVSLIIHDIWK